MLRDGILRSTYATMDIGLKRTSIHTNARDAEDMSNSYLDQDKPTLGVATLLLLFGMIFFIVSLWHEGVRLYATIFMAMGAVLSGWVAYLRKAYSAS